MDMFKVRYDTNTNNHDTTGKLPELFRKMTIYSPSGYFQHSARVWVGPFFDNFTRLQPGPIESAFAAQNGVIGFTH
jgi:hypothetical protein